ncbi:DCC1-like thiol-disulfide oxidoreductase family protein [Hydrogenibacillus schlegelii]|uniref:DUF393 domain-containing protein n=2 Tax=Hydrogenibacillus schlegelii TaxID=1484 RepID=A0A947CYC2_HYDSH|nr:DCC1-like thiol-disulfide oxidoreductase family protein [Hydrogenibacillus schlegelii]KWX03279.1 hypothetical protein TR75_08840 [Hydrogenibacillus schlegelii]MBT9282672.1 DUF393 domain-containing protein [Hydrogenibacillus schlegelii]
MKRQFFQITVFVDGKCALCRRMGLWIRCLDWLGLFRVTSYHEDARFADYGLSFEAVNREIHTVRQRGTRLQIDGGFEAVLVILKYLPPLWPLLPFAVLLRWLGLGPVLYRRWAENRRVFVGGACEDGSCPGVRGRKR